MAGFEPKKHLMTLKGKDYLEVKWRLVWVRDEHPDAVISTDLIAHSDTHAIFKATVVLPNGASATGYGSEDTKGFPDFLEKAETKALGRALAALGYGTQFCDDMVYSAEQVVDAPVALREVPAAASAPPDVAKANARLHAVAGKYGITHDDLHNWAVDKGYQSVKRATAAQMTRMADAIERKPEDARAYFAGLWATTDAHAKASEPLVAVADSARDPERFLA
jgi:hypothetical protein